MLREGRGWGRGLRMVQLCVGVALVALVVVVVHHAHACGKGQKGRS